MSLSADGHAFGTAYIDDGISLPPGPSSILTMKGTSGGVTITPRGTFNIAQRLGAVTVLGVKQKPTQVRVDGMFTMNWEYLAPQDKLVIHNMTTNLNNPVGLSWK